MNDADVLAYFLIAFVLLAAWAVIKMFRYHHKVSRQKKEISRLRKAALNAAQSQGRQALKLANSDTIEMTSGTRVALCRLAETASYFYMVPGIAFELIRCNEEPAPDMDLMRMALRYYLQCVAIGLQLEDGEC